MSGHRFRGPDRQPVWAHDRLDVRAEVAVFSGVPGVDYLALDRQGGLGEPVAVEQFAVEDHVGPAVGCGPTQSDVQVGRLGGEHRDALVAVAVRRRPGDTEAGCQQGHVLTFAKPDEHHQGLVEAGQRPSATASAAGPALCVQQPREMLHEFPRDVDHGTIGNHVEPSRRRGSVARTCLSMAPRLSPLPPDSPPSPVSRQSTHMRC